ncbi:hypothetical protein BJI67_11865 [Acidihalobacter aeolianus]|uniref:Uncharacterized protein n=1 Tax=Acidihalobacter aeolianus TaxID=2792603 RepID=A0A1D8K9Q1_9GAMM|nr:hypothetical protein BJI67_11865 [Acidihalobacter aeolianus]
MRYVNRPTPTVGITTFGLCFGSENNDRFWLPHHYVDQVIRAGGLPILLPPAPDYPLAALVATLDGLILTGGGDVEPARYDAPCHAATVYIDPARDAFEFALTRQCIERDIPVFAICRGMQVFNVALGGTLCQHLEQPEDLSLCDTPHRDHPRGPIAHTVAIDEDSHLYTHVGRAHLSVMSNHHQCVDHLGEGLRVCARADDGVIEAVESVNGLRAIAIQWHPELGGEDAAIQARLFDAFLGMCAEPARRQRSQT